MTNTNKIMHSRDVETDPAAIQIRINPKIRIRIQITFVSRSGLLIYVSRKAGQWRFALFECFCDYFTVFFLLVPVRKAAMNKLLKILYEILSVSASVLSVPGILFALHKVYEAWNS